MIGLDNQSSICCRMSDLRMPIAWAIPAIPSLWVVNHWSLQQILLWRLDAAVIIQGSFVRRIQYNLSLQLDSSRANKKDDIFTCQSMYREFSCRMCSSLGLARQLKKSCSGGPYCCIT